ncbi:MAG TPA: GNAT family N-acetyltransferase [Gaiellaceae bacterium]|nr:GNAT family N-acetyltransferase [Gaiellaceae bacterium]
MHAARIRETDEERDVDDILELWREALPTDVISRDSWLHYGRMLPPESQLGDWVGEENGRVVATAYVFLGFASSDRSAHCRVLVRSSHRRRGLGRALFELVEAHAAAVGAERLLAEFEENAAGVAFAQSLGFRQTRAEQTAVLDPCAVQLAPPADVDLRPLRDVDPRFAYEVDMEAMLDMPSTDTFERMEYEDWAGYVLGHPLLSYDGSFVALVDGGPAAVSLLTADPESGRASSMFTGTMRAHRGRGLALAVKLASIEWAARNGIVQLATRNDETNAPMLAINRKLGYRPAARRVEYLRDG